MSACTRGSFVDCWNGGFVSWIKESVCCEVEEGDCVGINSDILVSGGIGNDLEDVGDIGDNIVATEIVQSPVVLDGGEERVVGVEGVVSGTSQTWWDNISEKKSPDIVLDCVGFVFVKSDDEQGLVHKGCVVEERSDKSSGPIACIIDSGIVSVVLHVGSEECPINKKGLDSDWIPLRELVIREIALEKCEILDVCQSLGYRNNGVVHNLELD